MVATSSLSSFSIVVAIAAEFLVCCVQAKTVTNSPDSYFGGSNNQAYLDWVQTKGASYNASLFMPSDNDITDGAAVHWRIESGYIYLAVAARALGWLGFGIAEAGGMKGADLLLFESANPTVVTDAHVLDVNYPLRDDCQDWQMLSSVTNSSFLIVEVRRLLNTRDPQDRAIVDDKAFATPATRIIAAWGDGATKSYHGRRRARSSVRFYRFGEDTWSGFFNKMAEVSDGYFDLLSGNWSMRAQETRYEHFCIKYSEMVAKQGVPDLKSGVSIVGVEPIVEEAARPFLHHFTVYSDSTEGSADSCGITMLDMVYVWGPGDLPLQMPDNVAIKLGGYPGGGGIRSMGLEIHYNNPKLVQGVIDNSGIRVYYSRKPRQYEMAVLQTGDPLVGLDSKNHNRFVGDGIAQHVFTCPGACSAFVLKKPVTIFREALHMHQIGIHARNEQLRDGKVIHLAQADFFDFQQQSVYSVQQQPYQVLPGDGFRTTCTYQSNSTIKWGLSSQEEMCIAFLYYYPAQKGLGVLPWGCGIDYQLTPVGTCATVHNWTILSSIDTINRTFGKTTDTCTDPNSGKAPTAAPVSFSSCAASQECSSLSGRKMFWMYRGAPLRGCLDKCVPAASVLSNKLMGYSCGRCA